MFDDTGSQNWASNPHTVGKTLVQLWKETNEDLYKLKLEGIGNYLIDLGLVGTWQANRLQLIEMGVDVPELQRERIQQLVVNTQPLISEIIALGGNRTTKDEIRLLGLITVALSGGQDLPSSILQELNPSREAIDLYCLSGLIARNFDSLMIICTALKRNACQSRVMDAIFYYDAVKKTALVQRGEFIRDEEPLLITPWEDLSAIIKNLCSVIHLIHCQELDEALQKCCGILNKYPQCSEALWLQSAIGICNYQKQDKALWTLFRECELFGARRVEIVQCLLQRPLVRELCKVIGRDRGWGLDQSCEKQARSIEVQYLHLDRMYSEAELMIEEAADSEIANSSYDPFALALFASELERLELAKFPFYQAHSQQFPDVGILIVTGPEGPYMANLEHSLKQSGFNGLIRLDDCFEAMETLVEQRFKKKYPQDLTSFTQEEVFELQRFLWQNIAFSHGGKNCTRMVWSSENAFKYIGLALLLFNDCQSVCCLPPMRQLIVAQFSQMGGYTHKHATATVSELIAYLVDYSTIVHTWKLLAEEQISISKIDGHAGMNIILRCREILDLDTSTILANTEEFLATLIPNEDQYPRIYQKLEEFEDDINSIETCFAGVG